MSDDRRDFGISYSGEDIAWARWIAHTLETAGYTVIAEFLDYRAGGNFVLEMQRASEIAHRTIIVLSDHYFGTRFTQPEWAAPFAQDPDGALRRLVPVRVADCDVPGMLAQVIYIDLVGLCEQDAVTKLLTGIHPDRPRPETPPPFPGTA